MSSKEFQGDLKTIDPQKIINPKKDNKVDNFFLVLANVFNDLKGLVLFRRLIVENYRKPEENEISFHAGEYGGAWIQIYKILIATIHEFFEFLKDKDSEVILNSTDFKDILRRIPPKYQQEWKEMVEVALGQEKIESGFKKTLMRVRNNVAFHYSDAGKNLGRAFIQRFFKSSENERVYSNFNAYYASGSSMERTRFFYVDATIQEFIRGRSTTDEITDPLDYQSVISEIVDSMNDTIASLLNIYLEKRSL